MYKCSLKKIKSKTISAYSFLHILFLFHYIRLTIILAKAIIILNGLKWRIKNRLKDSAIITNYLYKCRIKT